MTTDRGMQEMRSTGKQPTETLSIGSSTQKLTMTNCPHRLTQWRAVAIVGRIVGVEKAAGD